MSIEPINDYKNIYFSCFVCWFVCFSPSVLLQHAPIPGMRHESILLFQKPSLRNASGCAENHHSLLTLVNCFLIKAVILYDLLLGLLIQWKYFHSLLLIEFSLLESSR